MSAVHFAFAVHNHQPVGNLDHVVAEAFELAYTPFLGVMERHPEMPFGLHLSGTLIDWAAAHRPAYLEAVGRLADRGQIEFMTGGYYEPILCALADEDKRGQVEKLTTDLERRFGHRPRGLWLAERVWEPGLVRPLAECGVDYTILDDTHFVAAGFEPGEVHGYYRSEDQGATVDLFPIARRLRYLVPFESPEATLAYLEEVAKHAPGSLVTLADDGEKLGCWPDTHRLVFEERWLERWVRLLIDNDDWIGLTTCGRYREHAAPRGLAYLPSSSYEEMLEWALPTPAQKRREALNQLISSRADDGKAALAGGFWRHFMIKYPEANHMHKRTTAAAARVRALGQPAVDCGARDHVWAAQCNCAYWHGVFGGLYLPHLRDAIYSHLLTAERLIDGLERTEHQAAGGSAPRFKGYLDDVDLDGFREVVVESAELKVIISPAQGGAIIEFDDRQRAINLANTLARRPEVYHDRLRETSPVPTPAPAAREGERGARSIHERLTTKEEGLAALVSYERGRGLLGVERLLDPETDLATFERGVATELADLSGVVYEPHLDCSGARVRVHLEGDAGLAGGGRLHLAKRWSFVAGSPAAELRLEIELKDRDTPLAARLACEWNFAMLAGSAPDRLYLAPGLGAGPESRMVSRGVLGPLERLGLRDGWRRFEVWLEWRGPTQVWRHPIETVSLSEAGVERVYQCSAVVPVWDVVLRPGEPHTLAMTGRIDALTAAGG